MLLRVSLTTQVFQWLLDLGKLLGHLNIWKIIYLNCRETCEDLIDHRSYAHNLISSCEIKANQVFLGGIYIVDSMKWTNVPVSESVNTSQWYERRGLNKNNLLRLIKIKTVLIVDRERIHGYWRQIHDKKSLTFPKPENAIFTVSMTNQ